MVFPTLPGDPTRAAGAKPMRGSPRSAPGRLARGSPCVVRGHWRSSEGPNQDAGRARPSLRSGEAHVRVERLLVEVVATAVVITMAPPTAVATYASAVTTALVVGRFASRLLALSAIVAALGGVLRTITLAGT